MSIYQGSFGRRQLGSVRDHSSLSQRCCMRPKNIPSEADILNFTKFNVTISVAFYLSL